MFKKIKRRTYTNLLGNLDDFFKSSEISIDNDGRMDVFLKETFDGGEDLTSKDDDRCGTITDLLILSSCEFNHGFGSWMLNINFSEDGVTIVGEDNTTHWVKEHLKHTLWSKGSSNNIFNGLCGFDVSLLGFLTLFSFGVFVQNVDWCLTHISKILCFKLINNLKLI